MPLWGSRSWCHSRVAAAAELELLTNAQRAAARSSLLRSVPQVGDDSKQHMFHISAQRQLLFAS